MTERSLAQHTVVSIDYHNLASGPVRLIGAIGLDDDDDHNLAGFAAHIHI